MKETIGLCVGNVQAKMFLNYPQAYSDESLGSWLWRLATANYLPSPLLILRELRTSISSHA
jgi:hypothetical protein